VPATSVCLPGLLFLLQPFTVLMKQAKQAVRAIKQSILLRCLWVELSNNRNHGFNHFDKVAVILGKFMMKNI